MASEPEWLTMQGEGCSRYLAEAIRRNAPVERIRTMLERGVRLSEDAPVWSLPDNDARRAYQRWMEDLRARIAAAKARAARSVPGSVFL